MRAGRVGAGRRGVGPGAAAGVAADGPSRDSRETIDIASVDRDSRGYVDDLARALAHSDGFDIGHGHGARGNLAKRVVAVGGSIAATVDIAPSKGE